MQVVLDFITGEISCEEFKAAWYADPSIGLWLDTLIDLRSEPRAEWSDIPYAEFRIAIHKYYKGSIIKFIEAGEVFSAAHPNQPAWLGIGWHFSAIAAVILVAYPDIIPTKYYDEEIDFYMASIGDYIGGPEVDKEIDACLEQFPRSMGKTKRKKAAKEAIRKLFHIDGRKYPRWAQEPEWPMGNNSPMAFISQKQDGDLVKYFFKDMDTGEERTVEQLY